MSEGIYKRFYASIQWRRCREAYKKSQGYLCERCKAKGLLVPATEVHHIVPLTPQNINDPSITLSFSNLMAVCERCHDELHNRRRYKVDEYGRVMPR